MNQRDVGFAPSRQRQRLARADRHRLHRIAGRLLEQRHEHVEKTGSCVLVVVERMTAFDWAVAGDDPAPSVVATRAAST